MYTCVDCLPTLEESLNNISNSLDDATGILATICVVIVLNFVVTFFKTVNVYFEKENK